jgi:ABC-2 type transport system permease protein
MIRTVFRMMLVTSLKDKITMFYALLFPILLMAGLGYYFDSPEYRQRLLVGVVALSTLFWAVQGVAFQVFQQRNKGVYKLLKLTPFPTVSFVLSLSLARTLLGMAINAVILLIGAPAFGIAITFSGVILLLGMLLGGMFCFTCLGFLVVNFARNEGQINMLSNLLQIPMVFGSEAFYRLSDAPEWLARMGKCLPFAYFVEGLQAAAKTDVRLWGVSMFILLGFALIILVLAALTFRWDPEHKKIGMRMRKSTAGGGASG